MISIHTSPLAELVERHRAFHAAYGAAPFEGPAGEKAFLASADTEAGEVLSANPPAIVTDTDLIAALEHIVEDQEFAQELHARLLRSALAYLAVRL